MVNVNSFICDIVSFLGYKDVNVKIYNSII